MSDDQKSIKIDPKSEDISTFSNFTQIQQQKVEIFASLDFSKKTLTGSITTTYKYIDKTSKELILDLKGPKIEKVELIENEKITPLQFRIDLNNEFKDSLGTPLIIKLPDFQNETPELLKIKIDYITDENCTGIQFLEKEQTFTKQHYFMFTQCEAIQCRTLFPIQDTPSSKILVEATLEVEKPYKFLFGGIEIESSYNEKTNKIITKYTQKIPIPSYLIALACGNLEYKKISERCGVYTEIGLGDKAKYEFEDSEKFIETAENYLGRKYDWEIYNLLVLPFSFPYGGMENPNLTFVTPSLLAGDKSLSNVIAHEISHSWTGNLVTNKNWKNFWVNEGFTIFMERKIAEILYGDDMKNLESLVGYEGVLKDIEMLGEDSTYTCLNPDIYGVDPDDGFTTVPYEKGFQLLFYLESLIGKNDFQNIMKNYIDKYKFLSIDYNGFKNVYEDYVKNKVNKGEEILKEIDWEKWINSKGKPFYKFNFESKLGDDAVKLGDKFLNGNCSSDDKNIFVNWHTNVKMYFLKYLIKNIDKVNNDVYDKLRDVLGFKSEHYNMEILNLWFQISLKTKHDDFIDDVKKFLLEIGRLKFVRPVYFSWYELQPKESKEFFEKNKMVYHPFARRILSMKLK